MLTKLVEPVEYALPIGDEKLPLNPYLGQTIRLRHLGQITCVGCGRITKKSFAQGYCYPCFTTKAACDRCIMSPELCHFAAGTCREPDWAKENCFVDHFVYLANSSGLKVGITRHTQVPTRWIDQGARQAINLFRVKTRQQSGFLEVAFKAHVNDKTHWQRMLKGEPEWVDLKARRDELIPLVKTPLERLQNEHGVESFEFLPDAETVEIKYPVVTYPTKVKSFNLDKVSTVEGTLLGIKGQYLILDTGVINLRKYGGYHIGFDA
ncbi:MAG: DUF2797 domain-containing protein [Polyangiaceae bacterium]|nr:DUF2797 domain-containing protein [Polyangiaceae bacterium]